MSTLNPLSTVTGLGFVAEVYARECERRGVNYLTPEELVEGDRAVEQCYANAAECWFEAEAAVESGDLNAEDSINRSYRYWLDEAAKLQR